MTTAPTNTIILAIVLIAILVAVVAWVIVQRQRSRRLKRRFGPEYDLTVSEFRSQGKAEAELMAREKRVADLKIVPLTSADAFRFSQAWYTLQGRFIDSPKGVVSEADNLVRELMAKRGYPMADFEHMAADVSVDHPTVVATYRAAQAIAARDARGEADTEQLRQAVVYYRTLFDELLGVGPEKIATLPSARRVPVHS
ncbi:MAG TPA: hypothetical protein VIY68_17585 [Steroidobacteraceae bacterium]